MKLFFSSICLWAVMAVSATAANWESVYTKIDLDGGCEFYKTHEQGGEAKCPGYQEYPIYFAEGDLRQMVQYGEVSQPFANWQSFGEFNRINTTVEWRLKDGIPVATILRWFIENHDNDAGMPTKKTEGQVLVISNIADPESPTSCVIGYVDARANSNANELARQVAEEGWGTFNCDSDLPKFHGKRGPYSGSPSRLAE